MLVSEPPFYIYHLPPPVMFGGIQIVPPYDNSKLAKEMTEMHQNLRTIFYQAYGIYVRTQATNSKTIATIVSPLEATIDKKCADYPFNKSKIFMTISQMLFSRGTDIGLVHYGNGFYVVHKMREKLDPRLIEQLIRKIDAAMINLVYNKFRISSVISGNMLRINAEIIPTDLYIV
jgi:hypothetical protein